jgi:hypothetical protein
MPVQRQLGLRVQIGEAAARESGEVLPRVGATLGASVLAVPIEPIPGLDALYDIAVPIFLIYYWFTFLREAYITTTTAARHSS